MKNKFVLLLMLQIFLPDKAFSYVTGFMVHNTDYELTVVSESNYGELCYTQSSLLVGSIETGKDGITDIDLIQPIQTTGSMVKYRVKIPETSRGVAIKNPLYKECPFISLQLKNMETKLIEIKEELIYGFYRTTILK